MLPLTIAPLHLLLCRCTALYPLALLSGVSVIPAARPVMCRWPLAKVSLLFSSVRCLYINTHWGERERDGHLERADLVGHRQGEPVLKLSPISTTFLSVEDAHTHHSWARDRKRERETWYTLDRSLVCGYLCGSSSRRHHSTVGFSGHWSAELTCCTTHVRTWSWSSFRGVMLCGAVISSHHSPCWQQASTLSVYLQFLLIEQLPSDPHLQARNCALFLRLEKKKRSSRRDSCHDTGSF